MLNEVIFYAIDSKRYGRANLALLLTKVSADKQCSAPIFLNSIS